VANTQYPTLPAVKAAIVDLLNGGDPRRLPAGVTAEYSWPGPGTTLTGVWLDNSGQEITTDTPVAQGTVRHYRHEVYRLNVMIQVIDQSQHPDGPSARARAVEEAAFAVLNVVDGLFADDKSVGDTAGVLEGKLVSYLPEPMEKVGQGWAARITATVEVAAWLI
jgi:hypothetical protein